MENRIELGSEFNLSLNSLNTVDNNLFQYLSKYSVQWYDYGRSAIRHIPIPSDKIILLPEFICESVIECFDKSRITFYKTDGNLNTDLEDLLKKITPDAGAVYVVHYFGYLQNDNVMRQIKDITGRFGITLIEDTAQSLFSEHELLGDYGVSSARKWMGVPGGVYCMQIMAVNSHVRQS